MSYTRVYTSRINWENYPSLNTPINETNLNKLDNATYVYDQTLANWDTTKANQNDLLLSVKTIDYDPSTGVFVFTWQNGTTKTVDLNIEKIPVDFKMSASGTISMTTSDGSVYICRLSDVIKQIDFEDSSVIAFNTEDSGHGTGTTFYNSTVSSSPVTVNFTSQENSIVANITGDGHISGVQVNYFVLEEGVQVNKTYSWTSLSLKKFIFSKIDLPDFISGYTYLSSMVISMADLGNSDTLVVKGYESISTHVTATIVDGSITENKLETNFLANCQAAQTGAEAAQTAAETAEGHAEDSAEDSEAWAVGQRNGTDVPSTDPTYHNNAKYYAEHGGGRALEDLTDVNIISASDGESILYDSYSSKWVNSVIKGTNVMLDDGPSDDPPNSISETIAPVESSAIASRSYAIGDQFIFRGQLVRATAAISSGGTIIHGLLGNCVSAKPIGEQIEFRVRSKNGSTITVEGGSYATTSCDFSSIMDEDESIISAMLSGSGSSNLVVRGTSISSRANVNASLKNIGTTTITNATPGFRVVTVKAPWKIMT